MSLPDFEDISKLIDEIWELGKKKNILDVEIKEGESIAFREAYINPVYFGKDGKPQSASFIKEAYEYSGLNGELISKRKEFAELVADYERAKLKFDTIKMQIDLYKAEQFNAKYLTM